MENKRYDSQTIMSEMQLQVIEERQVLKKDFKIYGDKENPLFLAKDVKDWIEHNNITLMLNNIDEDEKLTYVIHNSGQNREMWFLTEDGLYEVLMQSRKPIAKAFKKEVKKILKEIRMTGGYSKEMSNEDIIIYQLEEQKRIKQQLNEVNKHALRAQHNVEELEKDFTEYKENETLNVAECEAFTVAVKHRGVQALGGKGSNAYKDKKIRMRVFKSIHKYVKEQFEVKTYKTIKRKYFNNSLAIINDYNVPFSLNNEIEALNTQMQFGGM